MRKAEKVANVIEYMLAGHKATIETIETGRFESDGRPERVERYRIYDDSGKVLAERYIKRITGGQFTTARIISEEVAN